MSVKTDITVPISIIVASAATFITNAIWWFGFSLAHLARPLIVILLFLLPAIIVLRRRVKAHRSEAEFRRGAAYGWLIGMLVLLTILTSIAFTGIDLMGYWVLMIMYWAPFALVVGAVLGIIAMLIIARKLRRKLPDANAEWRRRNGYS